MHCYVFDVAPKQFEKNKRYFQGRIWVDDHDFQIVKNYGKSVPDVHLNKKGKGQENLHSQIYDLAGTNRREILVPHIYHSRTTFCIL